MALLYRILNQLYCLCFWNESFVMRSSICPSSISLNLLNFIFFFFLDFLIFTIFRFLWYSFPPSFATSPLPQEFNLVYIFLPFFLLQFLPLSPPPLYSWQYTSLSNLIIFLQIRNIIKKKQKSNKCSPSFTPPCCQKCFLHEHRVVCSMQSNQMKWKRWEWEKKNDTTMKELGYYIFFF